MGGTCECLAFACPLYLTELPVFYFVHGALVTQSGLKYINLLDIYGPFDFYRMNLIQKWLLLQFQIMRTTLKARLYFMGIIHKFFLTR